MAETCIVCLGDLAGADPEQPRIPGSSTPARSAAPPEPTALRTKNTSPLTTLQDQPETIAHLLPCGHDLHNECLKPWVERANSCPICRQTFNEVELKSEIYGPCIASYAVQDKRQVADIDPTMVVDDDPFEESLSGPCLFCDHQDDEDSLVPCDGCNGLYHTYCAGLESIPAQTWFCHFCHEDGMTHIETRRFNGRSRNQAQSSRRRNRRDQSPDAWASVWQSVWSNLHIDLDFPFDEEEQKEITQRTRAERRDIEEWRRRFRVAERQGGAARFRDSAAALLDRRPDTRTKTPDPESQEELRAWNAFDKARELSSTTVPTASRRNKRKSPSASPSEPAPQAERLLKRPRTRKAHDVINPMDAAHIESSSTAPRNEPQAHPVPPTQPTPLVIDGRSFFSALLNEVATSPSTPDGTSSRDPLVSAPNVPSEMPSSPASSVPASPTLSALSSPRSRSASPSRYPLSPTTSPPLTSTITPAFHRHYLVRPSNRSSLSTIDTSPPNISSEASSNVFTGSADDGNDDDDLGNPATLVHNVNRRCFRKLSSPLYSRFRSPNSNGDGHLAMSPLSSKDQVRSTKAEIQSMVSSALRLAYHQKDIDKDQYTDINRDVSRKMYSKVGDIGGMSNEEVRKRWEYIAVKEVELAVERSKRGHSTEVNAVA